MTEDQTEIHAGDLTVGDFATETIRIVSATIPELPALTTVPREEDDQAAQRTAALAASLVTSVRRFAPAAIILGDFESAADVRRRVAALADVIGKRALSRSAALDADTAVRWAERALGGAMSTAVTEGRMTAEGRRDIGPAAGRYGWYSATAQDVWETALAQARSDGSVDPDALAGVLTTMTAEGAEYRRRFVELAGMGLTSAQMAEALEGAPEEVVALARRYGVEIMGDRPLVEPVPPVDVGMTMAKVMAALEVATAGAESIRAAGVDTMSPELAADTASAMWRNLVPIMALRKELMTHGG